MKVIFESSNNKDPRIVTGDPMKFFVGNKLVNGHFVSVGYLIPQKDPRSASYRPNGTGLPTFGARTLKVNIPANDEQMQAYIQQFAGTPFGAALEAIRNSAKYQKVLALGDNTKTVPFDLGDCTLIKIGRYNFNWRDHSYYAANMSNRTEDIWKLRAKYGFGDFGDWTEDSWHNKPQYGGTGIYPRIESMPEEGRRWPEQPADEDMTEEDVLKYGRLGRYDGKSDKQVPEYRPTMADLYMNDKGRLALRQNLSSTKHGRSFYYFVSADGSMQEIDSAVIHWMYEAYKKPSAAKKAPEIEQMEADEAEFVKELEKLKQADDNEFKMLVLDRVLYIVGSVHTPDKKMERIAYVNDVDIYKDYPFLRRDEMQNVLPDWIKESTKELVEIESAGATGEFVNPEMNEAVKRAIAKSKKLNENFVTDEYTNLSSYLMDKLQIDPESDWKTATDAMMAAIADAVRPGEVNSIMKLLYTPRFEVKQMEDYDLITLHDGNRTYEFAM